MVPRLRISLSAPGINQLHLSQFVLKAIVIACLTFTICFWWIGNDLNEKITTFENQTHMVMIQTRQLVHQAKTENIDLSDQAIQKIPQTITFVKQVRKRVGFSWTQLLTDLESAVPNGLMMSTVSLDEKTQTVMLNGSTPSLKDLNQFIHRLEKHQAFRDVILTQHATQKNTDVNRSPFIAFSMKVTYHPHHRNAMTTMKS